MSVKNPRDYNTDTIRQTDRQAVGNQPDDTPPTGGSTVNGGGGGGSGITSLTGDVTATGPGAAAATIANAAVTLAKMANLAADSLLGNPTGSSATPSAITLGSGLAFSGTTLTATGSAGITQLTGDATAGPGSGSQALTLAAVNGTPGTFTNANITVNAKGLITAAANGSAGGGGYLNEYNVNSSTYGASPSASASANVTAINAAIAALNAAGGGRLLFPGEGSYAINATLTAITVPCEIVGMGAGVTAITQSSSTAGCFNITGAAACWIHGLNIEGGGTGGSGSGIALGTSSVLHTSTLIENCEVAGWATSINGVNIAYCVFQNNTIGGNFGVVLDSPTNPNNGSNKLIGNTLNCVNTCAKQVGASGTQMVGNYFAGGLFLFQLSPPAALGGAVDLWFVGNHLEDYGTSAIMLNAPATSGQYANIVIVGNEFANNGSIPSSGPAIATSHTSTPGVWLQRVIITGNAFADGVGLHAVDLFYAEFCTITGNAFGLHGAVSGVNIDSTCNNVEVSSDGNSFGFGTVFVTDSQTRTVATLQTASAFTGKRTYVTDATSTTFLSIVAGGGTNKVPVFSNGPNWLIG